MDDTKRIISKSILTATADAIRTKDGTSATITPSDFATKIAAIPSGKPEEVANVTPTTSAQTINPTTGSVFSSVSVSAVTSSIDSDIKAENIKKDVDILGVVGTFEGNQFLPAAQSTLKQNFTNNWVAFTQTTEKSTTSDFDFVKNIWTDGTNIFYSYSSTHLKFDKTTSSWVSKRWVTPSSITGNTNIWTDGSNIYYSDSSGTHYKYNGTIQWASASFIGSFSASKLWTDGVNIYYSSGTNHKVLQNGQKWVTTTWNGLTNFDAEYIWTDGTNFYYSKSTQQYVLDKTTNTWNEKTWTGLTSFIGFNVWTDGSNIYYSAGTSQYVLDKATSTWNAKAWTGIDSSYLYGNKIWTDGNEIYCVSSNGQSSITGYKLSKNSCLNCTAKPILI